MVDDNVATIKANDQLYTAWESVMVRRDYDTAISVFEFSAAENAYGPDNQNLKLGPGDKVEITLGGVKVLTGRITTRSVAFDHQSHQVVLAGRSLMQEALVSSVKVVQGNYNATTFEQATRAVLQPHGINLVMQNAPAIASKPFKNLAVQYGETCLEFISRIAMMRGLILTDDADGNLIAGQADASAAPDAALVQGVNILRGTGKLDDQSVVGKMAAVSQQPGDDSNWPPRDRSATLTDSNSLYPNRLHLFVSEHPGDNEDLVARVQYEKNRSNWPSVQCSFTVAGWKKADGSLWWPAKFVSIYCPMIFPTQTGKFTLGINSCTYSQDSQNGTTTVLEMVLPDLLTGQPTSHISDVSGVQSGAPQAAVPGVPDYQVGT